MTKILYNVTVKVDHDIVDSWQDYMKNGHMDDVLKTGCFESYKLTRLMYLDEEDGITFAAQYIAPNQAKFEQYHREFAKELQKDHIAKFGEKAVAFRTVMQIIQER